MWTKFKQSIWDMGVITPIIFGVAGLTIALRFMGWLQLLEWAALDQMFVLRTPLGRDPRVAIVAVDEPDIQYVGQWPMSDRQLADLLRSIRKQNPAAIGLDLYRDLPVEPGHQELVEVFESTPNLIGIEKVVGRDNDAAVAPPKALAALGQVAANDVLPDGDGKLRRSLLFVNPDNRKAVPSLGLQLALMYLQEKHGIEPTADEIAGHMKLGQAVFVPFEAYDGSYVRADAGGYQILLDFRGPGGSFEYVPMRKVMSGEIPPDLLTDRIVLIGPTAISLNDFYYTPYSSRFIDAPIRTPGVEVQANLVSQVLDLALGDRTFMQVWSEPVEMLWILAWSAIGGVVSWSLRSPWAALFAGGSLLGFAIVAFTQWHLWVPTIPAGLALGGSAATVTWHIARKEREERQLVMNLFQRHVTTQIAEAIWLQRHQLLKEGRLKGRQVTATVLFADLKNFSTVAEHLDPEQLMDWLNECLGSLADVVLAHGGVVDKFIGDAIMAVFGVPIPRTTKKEIAGDAIASVQCALAMASQLRLLNAQWQERGHPTTSMRVGISTGPVVIGSLGASQRLDYTTIGDSVNVAARLESYDKASAGGVCRIIISEETHSHTGHRFPSQCLGSVTLKGREEPVQIYQVLEAKTVETL